MSMQGRRVAHVVPALFGRAGVVGGAERYALELARAMAARTPTSLVAFGPAPDEHMDGPLRVRVLGPAHYVRGQRANPVHHGLVGEVLRADVIHCHQQHIVASTLAAVVARATGRYVACSDLGGGGWDLSAYVNTDRFYHSHLHLSEYSRRHFGHGDWPRARVIYGGVDAAKFSPDPTVPRGREIVFVGRLLPHKGVHDVVQAIGPGLCARVIGPEASPAYRAELGSLAAGRSVRFEHDLDDDGVVQAYRSAAAVVLPSVYESTYGPRTEVPELLGQTLIEAMACGAPTVCTRVASLPEVVEDGVTGMVVPPNDPRALEKAFRFLVEHPEEGARMGRHGRERVLARFTWPVVVDACFGAYES
jgi:glycosyltransferase involved in cell wall biosynthesis